MSGAYSCPRLLRSSNSCLVSLDLDGVLIQADALHIQKTLRRQIRSQFQGKRHIPFVASDHEISHGRNINWTLQAKQAPAHIRQAWSGTSWIVELAATGSRDGKPFCATHL